MPRPSKADRYWEACRKIHRAERYWKPIHKAQDERIKFLVDGEHYEDTPEGNAGELSKNRAFARWNGQESFNVWRHEVAATTNRRHRCYTKPIDMGGTPELGEIAVAAVGSHIEDPMVMWHDLIDDVVGSASACGVGVARLADFDESDGEYAALFDEHIDSRQFMWDWKAKSIHERRCEWVIIRRRETIGRAMLRKGWKPSVVKNLKPDDGWTESYGQVIETSTRLERYGPVTNQSIERDAADYDAEFTYYEIWERLPGSRKKPLGSRELEPGERYVQCEACGWKSDTQDAINAQLDDGGEPLELPEFAAGPCAGCGSEEPLERIDHEVVERTVRGYPNLRLTIIAPYSGLEECIFDGEPELAYRSFPFMHLTRFRHPNKPAGPSIADLNWWNQLCVDLIMTVAVERLMESAPMWSIPDDGVTDIFGQRFEFTTDNGRILLRDPSVPVGAIELIEGTGVPGAWSAIYANAMNALTSKTGITDFGLGESQSRDIPEGSVQAQVQQQEIPLAHYQRRVDREVGRAYGIIYDGVRETDTPQRLNRLHGADGQAFVTAYRLTDLPNYDFYLEDEPTQSGMTDMEQKSLEVILSTIETRPWAIDIVAEVTHASPSVVRRAKALIAQNAQAQAGASPAEPEGDEGPPGAEGQPDPGAQQPPAGDMVEQLLASIGAGGGRP